VQVYKFIRRRNSTSAYLIKTLVLVIWTIFTFVKLLEVAQSSPAKLGSMQALAITFQSIHNQLYFFTPTLSVAWLLLFKIPSHHELIQLVNRNIFNNFIKDSVIEMLILFTLGSLIGTLSATIYAPQFLQMDPQNLILAGLLLTLNALGWIISWHILAILSIAFNKLLALSIWLVFIFLDYQLLILTNCSLFLGNGLALNNLNYDLYILTDGYLYVGYIFLINHYQLDLLKKRSML
jgi:hypothetical protein